MEECSNSSLLDRTACILSYGGSLSDCAINYSLLAVSLTGCFWQLRRRSQLSTFTRINGSSTTNTGPSSTSTNNSSNALDRTPTLSSALKSLGFAVAYQVGLCLVLECSGISIVWCAAAGWMLSGLRPGEQPQQRELYVPLVLDVAGILYYAVTAEAITTVAHACALAMGAGLYHVSTRSWTSELLEEE